MVRCATRAVSLRLCTALCLFLQATWALSIPDLSIREVLASVIQNPANKETPKVTKDMTFNTIISGPFLPGTGAEAGCEDFEMRGPFNSLQFRMGASTMRGVTGKSIQGNETTVMAGAKEHVGGIEVDSGEYKVANNERIKHFVVGFEEGTNLVRTVAFDTDQGNSYSAVADIVRKGELSDLEFVYVPVGSGILARIRGTSCASGEFGSIGFDFIDELEAIEITNMNYEGFNNNIMPAGFGSPMEIGSMIFDNRNTSIEQRIVLQTYDSVSYSRTITVAGAFMIGSTLKLGGKAGVPLVSEGSIELSVTWSVTATFTKADATEQSRTKGAMYWLNCPAFKYCTASALFTTYSLSVNMEAEFTATTKAGGVYQWYQKGHYDSADSTAIQFNITETEGSDRSNPITRLEKPKKDLEGDAAVAGLAKAGF